MQGVKIHAQVVRRLVAAFFVILMLVTLFPFQVFAVDPVSAATMANALAQALTAYGASHGVSMMFDVSNTSGIGEGLHDLWGQFKTSINDNNVPTYDSLAVTLWTDLYTKVRNSVAINVSAENVGYFDQFWNWLLSGPAEMTKVDNQYFEWSVDPTSGQVLPVPVLSVPDFGNIPVKYLNIGDSFAVGGGGTITITSKSKDAIYYFYQALSSDVNGVFVTVCSVSNGTIGCQRENGVAYSQPLNLTMKSDGSETNAKMYCFGWSNYNQYVADVVSSTKVNIPASYNVPAVITQTDAINVRPYVGDAVPQNVPIPDTSDPDYSPLPYVGPLGVPWIDNNFGDGQSLTDAQREAIAGALDGAIEDDGTLTLEEDQTVPDNPGGEVIGGPSAYTVPGLADVFPFCIPFDIYHFLQALSAEPTPPHFTATLDFPEAVGGSQQIDIDFDTPTFNQIAAILRTMELLAFCVGLALLTRSMFLRG